MAYSDEHILTVGHAKAIHDKLEEEILTKAASNELAGLAAEVGRDRRAAEAAIAALDESTDGRLDTLEGEMDAAQADIDALEDVTDRLERRKADVNTVAGIAAGADIRLAALEAAADAIDGRVDVLESDMSEAQDDIEAVEAEDARLNGLIATKAGTADLAGTVAELDAQDRRIGRLEERADGADARTEANEAVLAMKADGHDLAGVAAGAEVTRRQLDSLKDAVTMKADANDLAYVAAVTDSKASQLQMDDNEERLTVKAGGSDAAAAHVEIDILGTRIASHTETIATILGDIGDINTAVAGKVPLPSGAGTNGQVLATDGEGGTEWADPVELDPEEIGSAVSDWLDDHPEATTTVEDGSITRAKLSQTLQDEIDHNAGAQDALAAVDGIATVGDARMRQDRQIESQLEFCEIWRKRFEDYSALFDGNGGHGFLFFSDPHTMPSKLYGVPQSDMLMRLKENRWILENTAARHLICGGDWITARYTQAEARFYNSRVPALIRREIGENAYTLVGTHDLYTEYCGGEMTEAQLARVWFDKDVGYYTIDGRDTRCFCFDSGPMLIAMTDYRWAQVAWFGELLRTNTYMHLYGAIHIWTDGLNNISELTVNLTTLADAFNKKTGVLINGVVYDYTNATGTFHFMVAGHWHEDFTRTMNNIPCFGTSESHTGLCTDACYADWENAALHMVRFGHGSSRGFGIIPNDGYQVEAEEE